MAAVLTSTDLPAAAVQGVITLLGRRVTVLLPGRTGAPGPALGGHCVVTDGDGLGDRSRASASSTMVHLDRHDFRGGKATR